MTGKELADKRKKCGLTQSQLAAFLSLDWKSICRMEREHRPIGRTVELSVEMLEIGNKRLDSWIASLDKRQQKIIWRRRQEYRIGEALRG